MTFVSKKALPRRTFLRGVGTALALPMLDAMVPALSAKSAKPTLRLGFVYVSNGVILEQMGSSPKWGPTSTCCLVILETARTVMRDHLNVLSWAWPTCRPIPSVAMEPAIIPALPRSG